MTLDVHVHLLEAGEVEPGSAAGVLPAEEIARAEGFREEAHRARFLARRVWMRRVLGSYVGMRPRDLPLRFNRFGKPELPGGSIGFSLSHSDGKAMLAVALGADLGCDLEQVDPGLVDTWGLQELLHPEEARAIASLASAEKVEAFYGCWTCKEAFVKALGVGLSMALDEFQVRLRPGRAPRLGPGCEGWTVRTFDPWPGFKAAVVAPGEDWRLSLMRPAA